MKYNKSEIMKKAWKLYKESKSDSIVPVKFSECLKAEWKAAKKSAANKSLEGKKYEAGMSVIDSNGNTLELTRWTKYGKDRLYIGSNCGYYDIQSKKFMWSNFRMGRNRNTPEIENAIRAIRF